MPHPGEQLEVRIEKLIPGGQGLARQEGFVLFVDRALPGQRLLVEVVSVKKRHGQAAIIQELEPAPEQVSPACPDFGICGGCTWQHLEYERQLFWKEQFVRESLERIGQLQQADSVEFRPIVPSPAPWFYRNKMEFAFAPCLPGEQRPRLGLRMRASSALVEVKQCRLQSPRAMEVLELVRSCPALSRAPAYEPRNGSGFWRYLVLRENEQAMVAQLITSGDKKYDPVVEELATLLLQRFPWLTGFVHMLRDSTQQVALGERMVRVFGSDQLEFSLGKTNYLVTANGFFQPNTTAAHCIYDTVDQLADIKGGEVIWDLYCGAGGIGLHIARKAALLAGFDISREALASAAENAQRNNISKSRFHPGDMRRSMRREKSRPDILLTDPPRSGMAPEVLEQILELGPGRIISVACDPATQARDIGRLSQKYELRVVQPVDMFPQTPHVENVALLTRRNG